MITKGKLTLVGAGPGDPELISLKGIKALQQADVVLYDALVHPDLLEHASAAQQIYVGKRAGKHSFKQEEINQLILQYALPGKSVVRLKGGDPFIFARGKEELEFAETFGIDTAVIPGISSVNLPGYYGIPLTVRGINESFWVITGTTSDGSLSKDVALAAQSTATVVILMGLRKLSRIVDLFDRNGKTKTPVAIISKGSLEDGKVIFGTIDNIVTRSRGVQSPGIIVIGDSVGTHPEFYERVKALKENYL